MRRHRGDPRYLVWIARRVAAHGALVIGLLGLGAGLARASGAPVFDPFAVNPLAGQSVGLRAAPVLGDLDADGDLDLVAGENYGNPLHYFQNTGTATTPAYVERVAGANPLDNVVADRATPSLGDLDGDGDLDLVVGSFNGTLSYFQNTGTANTPAFANQAGAANPFNGIVVGVGLMANPTLGDVDRDGDLDVLIGNEPSSQLYYFENTGTATAPAYVERVGAENPANGVAAGLNATPHLTDLDADGDLDVLSGRQDGKFQTSYLPEPAMGSMLALGAGLLRWLRGRAGQRFRATDESSIARNLLREQSVPTRRKTA